MIHPQKLMFFSVLFAAFSTIALVAEHEGVSENIAHPIHTMKSTNIVTGSIAPTRNEILLRGYTNLANRLSADQMTLSDSIYFAQKAMAVQRGEEKGPETLSSSALPSDKVLKLQILRDRVLSIQKIIGDENQDSDLIQSSAHLQVLFDCALVEFEAGNVAIHIGNPGQSCHGQLTAQLGEIEAKMTS